ncbi:STAS domain-containing protein [Streptomyces yaizuensis]|uniref:STAS domain-containing protein n=1 Tax=Streptomyces yaizuensis TaxID=2989713 RepID=A0ABQ5P4A7_9ACTN|nr:STAS domain-containing protein [Streptomyces sp. YSPA8]GLF97283.1 STAS domain-containing protein [Streptomyces sp. YSPA8]
MTLTVEEDRSGPWTVLRVRGEWDPASCPEVRRRVHAAVAAGRRDVVLDLTEVASCEAGGVGVLIAARRLLNSCGGRLRLVLPATGPATAPAGATQVRRVLESLGVRRLFEVYGDLTAATGAAPAV